MCDCHKTSNTAPLRMLLLLAALFFAVVAMIFLAGAAAIAWLAFSGKQVATGPSGPLLLATLVVMVVIVLLLLLLLWCCCGGRGKGLEALRGLASFLPFLRDAAAGLGSAAAALESIAWLVRQTRTRVDWAGGEVRTAGDNIDIEIPTVSWTTGSVPTPTGQTSVITGISAGKMRPFGEVTTKLHNTADHLNADTPESVTSRLEDVAVKCGEAAAGLRAAKTLLDAVS